MKDTDNINEHNDLTIISRVPDITNANLIKSFLESNGIECQIQNSSFSSVMAVSGGVGETQVLVAENDSAEALKLINDLFESTHEPLQNYEKVEKSETEKYITSALASSIIGSLLLMIPFVFQIYSLYLLYKAKNLEPEVYKKFKWKVRITIILDILPFVWLVLLLIIFAKK